MIKHILICTDGSSSGDVACEYGLYLAAKFKARCTGLHVLDSRMLEGPLMADISGWIGAQPFGHQLEQFRSLLEQKGNAVVDAFNDRVAKAGVTGEGILRMGHPSRVIIDEEARAELVVLGQRGVHSDMVGEALGSTVERVVRNSVKPCLVTPNAFSDVRKILAAYDGSGHAKKALDEAIEMAKALDVELIILTAVEKDDVAAAEKTSREAMQLAESHECRAVALMSEESRSSTGILESAREQGADLIVMGAYGHSRIREMILGSTTQHVITHANIPVMLVR